MRCDDRDNNKRKTGATFPLWLFFFDFSKKSAFKRQQKNS